MSVTESQRRQLYADLERTLGAESAAAMMDLLPPVGWGDLVRQADFDAQCMALRAEMKELRTDLTGELNHSLGALESVVAKLDAKVDVEVRRIAAINAVSVMAASISTAGLMLGVFAIAR